VAQEVFAKDAASGIADVVKGMLDLDPRKRLTPREALRMPFFQPQSNSQESDGRRR
jgi:serine/threonine protein kinase